ncbi:TPM domain-containing protein [Pseudotenacibaculum haliotis]|uniref:TPM domain-containing protein n=1 Tax=Pseudotenacibaculum haliotis TaxID=1862138 RepID=A0ABW5LUL5_9FLAO
MSEFEHFLSQEDEKAIVAAIKEAEKNTSGEIRVHIEAHTDFDHYEYAQEVFANLGMHKTELRNGVLIYIAVNDHRFVILGDEGINNVVADDFWEQTKNIMQGHFLKGDFKTGIVEGILQAGQELKAHFPYQSDDIDELSNEISKSS